MGIIDIKTEIWNEHEIRFVLYKDEWWAVAKDVAVTLEYSDTEAMTRRIDEDDKSIIKPKDIQNLSDVGFEVPNRGLSILTEFGVYDSILGSEKPEAKEFKKWVKGIIKKLRQAVGLEGYQILRMLDKEHHHKCMKLLNEGLEAPVRVDYIKSNTIANKAISTKHGHPKMLKKDNMTPEMLVERQVILDATVELMVTNERYGLGLSVSSLIYERFCK